MHRLLYTSRIARSDNAMGDIRIEQIAAVASARNASLGLTGILVQVDDLFIQVIEGELSALESVFERICCDFRHFDLRLIDLVSMQDRIFGEWNMACLAAGADSPEELREELDGLRYLVSLNAGVAVAEMRRLLESQTIEYEAA